MIEPPEQLQVRKATSFDAVEATANGVKAEGADADVTYQRKATALNDKL